MKSGACRMMSRAFILIAGLITIDAAMTISLRAQSKSTGKTPDLAGIYEAVSRGTAVPGGLKGSGTLADIELKPAAIKEAKARNLEDDPAKNCQVIGPFRMMARDDNKIEVVTSPDRINVMFENNALGNMRQIFLQRKHLQKMEPTWMGDSVGSWEGDTLVVDAVGFNDRTWLNDAGAPHSKGLRLIERYRLVDGGKFLEYEATAEDPDVLVKPYMYTRYYRRTDVEFKEDFCGR